MSADFLSYVAPLKAAVARKLFAELETARSVVEDVVDPTGSPVFDPASGEPYKPRRLAKQFRGKAPGPEDFASAHVEIRTGNKKRDAALLASFGEDSRSVASPNYPAIIVVDRVLAIPYGMSLLRGLPGARFRPKGVTRLSEEWPALLERIGGSKKAARRVAKYFDRWENGEADANKMINAISHGIQTAADADLDLLLVGLLAP